MGNSTAVEPYSGHMLETQARWVTESDRAPGPVASTTWPTTPSARRSSATVRARSMALTPGASSPVRRSSTTRGTSMGMGWPSAAASASMPPTPQPMTPRPLAVVVWESVPTRVSKQAMAPSPPQRASVPTTSQKRSTLSWWQMPWPGGTMVTLSNEAPAHLRKANRSALRRASTARLSARADGQPASSAATEWSTTSTQGILGFTRAGSPPRAVMASRMAAKSQNTGTPVKSWNSTRAGMKSTSSPASPERPASTTRRAASQAASSDGARRTTFSSRRTRAEGRRMASGMPETSTMSRETPPASRVRGVRAAATAAAKAAGSGMCMLSLLKVAREAHVGTAAAVRGLPTFFIEHREQGAPCGGGEDKERQHRP